MTTDNDKGVRERITARLLEATDTESLNRIRKELIDAGEKEGSVSGIVSDLRKKGYLNFDVKSGVAITKALPVEGIVENLPWPADEDGHVDGAFVAGMKYEAMNVIRGIRLAQELTKMGVDQAAPIMRMAAEMRESEGKAAQVIATELAQATLESNRDILAAISNINIAAKSQDPVQMMVARMQAMPQMMMAAQGFMRMFGMQMPLLGQPGGMQPPTSQAAGPTQEATDKDIEEAFGG